MFGPYDTRLDVFSSNTARNGIKSFQEALGITDAEAADLNVKAAIKSAAADGEITDDEAKSIEAAAKAAKMSDEDTAKAVDKQLKKKDD